VVAEVLEASRNEVAKPIEAWSSSWSSSGVEMVFEMVVETS